MADTNTKKNPNVQIEIPVSEWDENIKKAVGQRNYLEKQWYENLSFYRGNQWAVWMKNSLTSQGVSLMRPTSARKRLVVNKIKPRIRWEFTKLISEEPQFYVAPNTTDQSDIAASKTGEALSEYLMAKRKFNKVRRQATWWTCQTGIGFIKTEYHTDIPVPGPKKMVEVAPGKWEERNVNPDGNIFWSAVSPFHLVVPHLDREELEDQPWVIHLRTVDPKVAESTYGVKLTPDSKSTGENLDGRFLQSINVRNADQKFDQVYLKELWLKPCAEYPSGLVAVWANDTLLWSTEYPYAHGEFPFAEIRHVPSGGFYGYSTIEDLIPLQKEYNLTVSQLAESRDLTSKPAIVAEKGTDAKQIKAVPGQIIFYNPGAEPPRRFINPEMPGYVMEGLDRNIRDQDDASAYTEVAQGRTPPGVEAASAIAYLQEENSTKLYHTIASLEDAVAKAGSQALQLIQQYWDETRIINTVSSTHVQGSIEFKNKDLKNNTDLRVIPGSMAPRSRAAKQATIMELADKRFIPPQVALKHLGMSETNLMFQELFIDEDQARRENLRLARGENKPTVDVDGQPLMNEDGTPVEYNVGVKINDWDNHEIHIEQHNNFRKSQEYEILPEEVKIAFNEHVELHMKAVEALLMAEEDGAELNEPDGQSELGLEPEPGIIDGINTDGAV